MEKVTEKAIVKVQELTNFTAIKIVLPSGDCMQVNVFEDSIGVGTMGANQGLSIEMRNEKTITVKPINK